VFHLRAESLARLRQCVAPRGFHESFRAGDFMPSYRQLRDFHINRWERTLSFKGLESGFPRPLYRLHAMSSSVKQPSTLSASAIKLFVRQRFVRDSLTKEGQKLVAGDPFGGGEFDGDLAVYGVDSCQF